MSTPDITYPEAIAGFRALAREIGPDAYPFVALNIEGHRGKRAFNATLYVRGVAESSNPRIEAEADTLRELLAAAQVKWVAMQDRHKADRIAKMASDLIRITFERGDCDDTALRQAGFSDREIADLGMEACDRANRMSARAPFMIRRNAKSNGLPPSDQKIRTHGDRVMKPSSPDAEKVADAILKAAGSGFRYYMPSSKAKIVAATEDAIRAANVDLLAALKEIVASSDAYEGSQSDDERCREALEVARAAIARAEGGANV